MFWNYGDQCPDIGCDLGKYGALDVVIATLKKLEAQPDSKWKFNRLLQLLGILHNSAKHERCAANHSIFRKEEAAEALKKLIDTSQMLIKLDSLMVFSCIASDNDSEILGQDVIVFLVDLLKESNCGISWSHLFRFRSKIWLLGWI